MGARDGTHYEHMSMKISTVVSALVGIAILVGGYWANALDDDITEVKKVATTAVAASTTNASEIKLLIQALGQTQKIVDQNAKDARENTERLIRIDAEVTRNGRGP